MRFSLDRFPERERPFFLREVFGNEFTYDVEPLPDVPLVLDLEFQALSGLMTMSGTEHGLRTLRSQAAIAAAASDDVGLVVNLSGPLQFTRAQEEIVLGDGEAVLVSLTDTYSFVHRPPGRVLALRVPRAPFASLVADVDDLCYRRIPNGIPALRFLLDYSNAAQDDQMVACPKLQRLFVAHINELMALAVGATREGAEFAQGGLRAARLNAVKQDIGKHLDRPDLSVRTIANRHGLTERLVQRLFEAEGITFTEYVLARRLARAHSLLADPRRDRDKISTVAYDCGFADVSYFNRTFRRQYGTAPSEIRARGRQA